MPDEITQFRAELEASEARFRAVIARIADAIVVTDPDGVVLFANPAAAALFGRPAEALVGTLFGFPVVAGDTTELDVVGRAGQAAVAEMRVVETEWEGRPASLASLRDITERKQAEQQRARLVKEQAARLEAEAALRQRDEFLATVAHELRTPLTSIRGYAQLLCRQIERGATLDRAQLGRQLGLVDLESEKLARLITQLLDVTTIRTGRLTLHPERVEVAPLLERVATTARRATDRHRITVEAPTGLRASVDPHRFEQVLNNLVENAIRYSPDGGTIELTAGAGVVITVRDYGLGIPPEARAGLFDRFHQAHRIEHRSGLGLGLFVARQIIRLHGGELEAEFPPDGGTRFVIRLPAAP